MSDSWDAMGLGRHRSLTRECAPPSDPLGALLAVHDYAAMPAVLFEAGVIVNRDEELRMRDPAVQNALAASVADGIHECMIKRPKGEEQ